MSDPSSTDNGVKVLSTMGPATDAPVLGPEWQPLAHGGGVNLLPPFDAATEADDAASDERDTTAQQSLAAPDPSLGGPGPVTAFVIHHINENIERGNAQTFALRANIPGSTPVRLLGKDDTRSRAVILNIGANEVDVGNTEEITFGGPTTFPLGANSSENVAGASLTVHSRDEVWALCKDVDHGSSVAMWITRSEPSGQTLGTVTELATDQAS